MRGLEPRIAEKVEIHPYWSFEDVCKLAFKVEKCSKGKRQFSNPFVKPNAPPKLFVPSKLGMTPKKARSKDKGKAFVKEFPKKLDGKRCFKCQCYGLFQAGYPNRRVLTLKEIEEIDHYAQS